MPERESAMRKGRVSEKNDAIEESVRGIPGLDDWPDLVDPLERDCRKKTLEAIRQRVREDGPHRARSSVERGRLFMPFAALKGYDEMLAGAETEVEGEQEKNREGE